MRRSVGAVGRAGLAAMLLAVVLSGTAAAKTEPRVHTDIINGARATLYEAPWIAFMTWQNPRTRLRSWCTGSAVTRHLILTAAHCVLNERATGAAAPLARDYAFRLHSLKGGWPETPLKTSRRYTYAAYRVIWDAAYQTSCATGRFCDAANDYALLYVRRTLPVSPVRLNSITAPGYTLYVGNTVHTYGYGQTNPVKAIYPNRLLRGDMFVYDPSFCHVSFNSPTVFDGQICIGWYQGGRQTCHGDSGGPTVIGNSYSAVQVGVTSYGLSGYCNAGRGVVADVAWSNWLPYWISRLNSGGHAADLKPAPPTGSVGG
jgi:Trypsin